MEMQTSTFERQKGMALYKQIYLKLRKDIMQGYLKREIACQAYVAVSNCLKYRKQVLSEPINYY